MFNSYISQATFDRSAGEIAFSRSRDFIAHLLFDDCLSALRLTPRIRSKGVVLDDYHL